MWGKIYLSEQNNWCRWHSWSTWLTTSVLGVLVIHLFFHHIRISHQLINLLCSNSNGSKEFHGRMYKSYPYNEVEEIFEQNKLSSCTLFFLVIPYYHTLSMLFLSSRSMTRLPHWVLLKKLTPTVTSRDNACCLQQTQFLHRMMKSRHRKTIFLNK